MLIIALCAIPVTAAVVAFFMRAQTQDFLEYLEENQQIGGQPIGVYKDQLEDRKEEREARKEASRPRLAPTDLLRG